MWKEQIEILYYYYYTPNDTCLTVIFSGGASSKVNFLTIHFVRIDAKLAKELRIKRHCRYETTRFLRYGAGHGMVFDRTLIDIRNPNCTDAKIQSKAEPCRSNALALARIKPKWKHDLAVLIGGTLRERRVPAGAFCALP